MITVGQYVVVSFRNFAANPVVVQFYKGILDRFQPSFGFCKILFVTLSLGFDVPFSVHNVFKCSRPFSPDQNKSSIFQNSLKRLKKPKKTIIPFTHTFSDI